MGLRARWRLFPRWRKRGRTQRPFDEKLLPPTEFLTVAESTEEGLLLTEYACRMAVKNRFIKKILADKTPWFIEQSLDDAREALRALARESENDARNLEILIDKYRNNPHAEADSHGYGFGDIDNMEHRREVSQRIAERLREQSDDNEYLAELVEKARRDAWREISANIEHNLDVEYFPLDEEYERNREDRLRAFIEEDLASLLEESADLGHSSETTAL